MINKVLQFLTDQLGLKLNKANEPKNLLLTSIVNEKGELNIEAGKIALTLVNIDEERALKAQLPRDRRNGDQVEFANPEIRLNLFIMLAANPGGDNYNTALERLSIAMLYFQGTSFFNRAKYAALAADPIIEQISVELHSLSFEQQNQLWGSLGAKYLPSAIYKVRVVIMADTTFGPPVPVIKTLDNDLQRIN